ncbi:caspase-3-like isoform X2 [Mytilus californianus]|uniref:caspase-3-like isoform X2 n=1 Tax=Mytilus californianus TaxID=6549 RepID=UPI0022468015|nr:caspase-3-like isoform X2 [Mytilus californianus]
MADWKKAFRANRTQIVKNLANPDDVAGYLFSDSIFTEEMRDAVQQEPETENKNRLILDTLDRRGPRSVKCLYNAFQETLNDDLADLLADYAKLIDSKENLNDPKAWPPSTDEQAEMEKHGVFTIKDTKSPLMHDYKKDDVYKLHGKTRGKVFMISNTFSKAAKHLKREGSSVDVKNLTELFHQLHFEVVTKTDLTAQEMVMFLKKERNDIKNWNEIECVVLILMSHGKGEYIYGDDNIPVNLADIIGVFDSVHCPGLDEKPRLVFVQACRGDEEPEEKLKDVCLKMDEQTIGDQLDSAPYQPENPTQVKHPSADFLVVYATPAGTLSYRNIHTGSWFLCAVVWTFKYHAKHEELQHLLIRVNRLVAKGKGPDEFGQKLTVSEVKSNLRKKFYFFPGVHGDSPQLFK